MDYEFNDRKWGASTLGTESGTITWSLTFGPSVQIAASSSLVALNLAIEAAFRRWEDVAAIDFERVATNAASDVDLYFTSLPGSTVGKANYSYWLNPGIDEIFTGYIQFDSDETWSAQGVGGTSLFAVALHEIGHILGFGHTDSDEQIMYFQVNENDLGAGDIEGVQYAYGTSTLVYAGTSGSDLEDRSRALRDVDLSGGAGNDTLLGGEMDDLLRGGSGLDVLEGGNGNDIARGQDGNDEVHGGAGNDTITGGLGEDMLFGDAGVDRLDGGDGADSLNGGADGDQLLGEAGNDTILGGSGADTLVGGKDDDQLTGGADDDILKGNAREDILDGGAGDDKLRGGAGSDTLIGGEGSDFLLGGAAADVFVFDQRDAADFDRVRSFETALDTIALDGSVYGLGGSLTAAELTFGTSAATAQTRIVYDQTKGKLYSDIDGTGAGDLVLIARFDDGTALTFDHFELI